MHHPNAKPLDAIGAQLAVQVGDTPSMKSILPIALIFTFAACDGSIVGPRGEVSVTSPPPVQRDAGPPPCAPTGQEVPKLLRLSNHEYRSMVADVLGVPVDEALFARWTPVAQVYGFDTMSETRIDAQGLEVQLATAESLAALVMATPSLTAHCPAVAPAQTPMCTKRPTYSSVDDFSDSQGRDCWAYLDSSGTPMVFDNTRSLWRKEPDQTVLLWQLGSHPGQTVDSVRRWQSPVDGTVSLNGFFNDADPGGGDGIVVFIRRNGTQVFTQDVPNGGQAPFNFGIPVARGDQLDFVVNRKANPSYDSTSFQVSMAFKPTPRKSTWTWGSCVEPLVARLASRAFRRPVREAELADYQSVFTSNLQEATTAGFAEPVDEAMAAVLEAVFMSPNFVFKPELVPGGLDPNEKGFGVASRLGLFFRGSIADEPLWNLAGTGGLNDPNAVRAQAVRLLEQDRERFTQNFGGQWLDFRDAEPVGPLTDSMQAESRNVFGAVLGDGLPPEALLQPGFTFADAPLAAYYGLTPSTMGNKVMTPERGGVLTQAAFLIRTANGSEFRRPIHRGLWVLTRLMCRQMPRLDPATLEEITASFGNIDRTLPLPQQMAIHRNSAMRCGGCHDSIDPVGLALEKYDTQGKWRETYANGAPIVSDLQLNGTVVRNPSELASAIANGDEYRTCVATKLLTFGLNRGPLENEQCLAQKIGRPADGSKPTLEKMTIEALMHAMELTEVTP